MSVELLPYNQTEANIIENAEKFSQFLSSETVNPIRPSITIIPSLLKNILNYTTERRVIKEESKRFNAKTKLANEYLRIQERNSQRQCALQVSKFHKEAEVAIREIGQQENIELKRIKAESDSIIKSINAAENAKLAKINAEYKLMRIQKDNEMRMFLKGLKENGRRFDKCMQEKNKFQVELSQIIKLITKKIEKGTATKDEYHILEQVIKMKTKTLTHQFDMSETLVKTFGEGL